MSGGQLSGGCESRPTWPESVFATTFPIVHPLNRAIVETLGEKKFVKALESAGHFHFLCRLRVDAGK